MIYQGQKLSIAIIDNAIANLHFDADRPPSGADVCPASACEHRIGLIGNRLALVVEQWAVLTIGKHHALG